ncbi:MAG: NAD(P)H-dependent oxidoreductase [Methanobacterium sp.]|nr:NAD(P)H-dependent oxidoreductase [Methanobacterium sp.]
MRRNKKFRKFSRVLTIIGSPRKKGNSYQAAKKLEEEMKNKGDYEFEYLFLKDAHLESCKGCFNCVSKGDEICPLKDDRKMIEEKMGEADGLILVSPVYVMTVTALMKNFIDRLAYRCHRPAYHGKKALVLSTTGGIGVKETLKYMELVVESWGYDVVAKCGQITPPWPQKEGMKKKNRDKLLKSAAEFYKSLKSVSLIKQGKSAVKFRDYMSFRIFQTVSGNVEEYMPADYKYYKNKEYYKPAKIGIPTKILTEIMLKVIFFMMRDMGPGNDKK